MDSVGSSSDVGGFAKIAKHHSCGKLCAHPLFKDRADLSGDIEKNNRCAGAHMLHALEALGGEKQSPKTDAIMQAVMHPSMQTHAVGSECLDLATSRLLGTTKGRVEGARNKALGVETTGIHNDARAFDLELVYNFIHGIATRTKERNICVDFCPIVELNKAAQTQWNGKSWESPFGTKKLYCRPHLRRGTLSEIAETFLNSETYRE